MGEYERYHHALRGGAEKCRSLSLLLWELVLLKIRAENSIFHVCKYLSENTTGCCHYKLHEWANRASVPAVCWTVTSGSHQHS